MAMSGNASDRAARRVNPLMMEATSVQALKHLLSIETTSGEPRITSRENNLFIEYKIETYF